MAHNLNVGNGRPGMFYTGETPWHGLGKKLDGAATAAEAIAAAGLSWSVDKKPVFLGDGKRIADKFATVRGDNGMPLGIVGNRYSPLQNKEAFSFFDAVVGSKEAIYHTAGALGDGERVWILAKLPGHVRVVGDDVTEKFLLLTNSHDGTSPVSVLFTPIRVVCQNTLNVALSDKSNQQKLRHTRSMGLKVTDVREGLGIVNQQFEIFEQAAQALAKVQMSGESWRAMLKEVGIIPADEMSTRAENIMDEVSALFEGRQMGGNMPGVKGTAWGAFNAISEYADFHRSTKGDDKARSRATSLLFGSGAQLKQRAWDSAFQLIGGKLA